MVKSNAGCLQDQTIKTVLEDGQAQRSRSQPTDRNMIRLLTHSTDGKLQLVLQQGLGIGFQVSTERRRDKVTERAFDRTFDVLILDVAGWGNTADQLEYFEELRPSRVPVVVMMDEDCMETAMALIRRGAHSCFLKPPSIAALTIAVRRAYECSILNRDPDATRAQEHSTALACDQLIGSSAPLQYVYDLIQRLAPVDASVLITGESGTGKELIARALHNLSDRKSFPFVAVSCGAIPDALIEAELFGCEKGAFTGSIGNRTGFLEHAGHGTVLLDEIGELSRSTQVKLLRVVQERLFNRLGSSTTIPLHARMVFATHRDLAQMVDAGEFRLDLYYRINVMGIKAPALRDHPEDIPILARHFLAKYAEQYQKPVSIIAESAMALLVEHSWPGNVRELENVIQKAIILSDDGTTRPEHLPHPLQQLDIPCVTDALPTASFEDRLLECKIRIAQKAIEECNGNKTLAARSLQVSRTYLHRLIKEPVEGAQWKVA